jgi:RsiW-degrading membrane proteinase PrsW (M82 family)
LHGIREAKYIASIERGGARTTGTVNAHGINTRARSCGEYALISYEIEGIKYIINANGCNAHHSKLPVGSLVHILYLQSHPNKGIAIFKGSVDTSKEEWFIVIVWCISGIICAFMSYAIIAESFKKQGRKRNAAA